MAQYAKRLRAKSGFYVCEIRGAVFITWVSEAEKDHAAELPLSTAVAMKEYVSATTGVDVEIVDV